MEALIKRLTNPTTGKETGAILSALPAFPIGPTQKAIIDTSLRHYAHNILYPGKGLNVYSSIYSDTPAIVAILEINEFTDERAEFSLVVELF